MVFHLKYFQAAEMDLKAAKILVKENLFPPTLYYLQQAYEKCIKSYYIFRDSTNAVKEEERGRDPNLLDALYLLYGPYSPELLGRESYWHILSTYADLWFQQDLIV